MLQRKWFAQALCVFVLWVPLVGMGTPIFNLSADVAEEDSPVEITLHADKAETTPNESVTLQELVPSAMVCNVGYLDHDVLRIGRYDNKLGKLVNLNNHCLARCMAAMETTVFRQIFMRVMVYP